MLSRARLGMVFNLLQFASCMGRVAYVCDTSTQAVSIAYNNQAPSLKNAFTLRFQLSCLFYYQDPSPNFALLRQFEMSVRRSRAQSAQSWLRRFQVFPGPTEFSINSINTLSLPRTFLGMFYYVELQCFSTELLRLHKFLAPVYQSSGYEWGPMHASPPNVHS